MKYNVALLNRLEKVLHDSSFVIINERGNFKSGWCLLRDKEEIAEKKDNNDLEPNFFKRVIVINKFLPFEGKVNTLIDIILSVEISESTLTPDSLRLYKELTMKHRNLLPLA
ncbi:MAG: hypothetical protein QM528_02710 [Phycisphaerales bacterium]|nr:hypothetical protein [Phycisphaerales bacterium]